MKRISGAIVSYTYHRERHHQGLGGLNRLDRPFVRPSNRHENASRKQSTDTTVEWFIAGRQNGVNVSCYCLSNVTHLRD